MNSFYFRFSNWKSWTWVCKIRTESKWWEYTAFKSSLCLQNSSWKCRYYRCPPGGFEPAT